MDGGTADELAAVMRLVRGTQARSVAIGHGRHDAAIAAAQAFAEAWTAAGFEVVTVLDWPATAASWLRQARRLATAGADAIVLADTPEGRAQVTARLAEQPGWSPDRTFGFGDVVPRDHEGRGRTR